MTLDERARSGAAKPAATSIRFNYCQVTRSVTTTECYLGTELAPTEAVNDGSDGRASSHCVDCSCGLENSPLIDYSYGTVRILDRDGLRKRACECYKVIEDHLDNYAAFARGVE